MNCCLLQIQQRIYDGNESALAELYQLFSKKLFHFSKAITKSVEESEEIVEDVFVKIWCNRFNILQIENLSVYLYVAVKNKSLNVVSRNTKEIVKHSFENLEVELCELTPDPYQLLVTGEVMKKMQEAVESLPPRCKMIFKLVRENGLKYKEVAEILNISVNTIDVQMAIATKKICQALENSQHTAGLLSRFSLSKKRN